MYHTDPPTDKTIREWYMKFQQSGCLCNAKRTGRPGPSAETVERVRETFVRSPEKSTTRPRREFQMSQSSVWRILRKRLRVKGYRVQVLQALNPQDYNLRFRFCLHFQQRLREDGLAEKLVFSDEATFRVCGNVEAVAAIDRQMLQRVSQELDYRIDICRVTKGAHIEHL